MQEELTEAMHSEFTISKATEIKLKAGCVWTLLGFDASKEEIEMQAKSYGITYAQAMRWKSFWEKLSIKSGDYPSRVNKKPISPEFQQLLDEAEAYYEKQSNSGSAEES